MCKVDKRETHVLSLYNGLLFEFGLQCRIRHIRGLLKKRMIFFSLSSLVCLWSRFQNGVDKKLLHFLISTCLDGGNKIEKKKEANENKCE